MVLNDCVWHLNLNRVKVRKSTNGYSIHIENNIDLLIIPPLTLGCMDLLTHKELSFHLNLFNRLPPNTQLLLVHLRKEPK